MTTSTKITCLLTFTLMLFSSTKALTDVEILNFALNLEYLEATFYSMAAFGVGLSDADRLGGPRAEHGLRSFLSPEAKRYARDIYSDEIAHVRFLQKALGSAAVKAPRIDIGFAIAGLAKLAGYTSPWYNGLGSDELFYLSAFIFEDVGVTAYKGAARFITNTATLEAAAGILAVEAYHAGAIRERLLARKSVFLYPYPATIATVANKTAGIRQAVSGVADFGILQDGLPVLVPQDANSIVFSRTPEQVLKIVYLGGTTKGGFFPAGINT